MLKILSTALLTTVFVALPVQASVIYSGNVSGKVTATAGQMDTGNTSYNSGNLSSPLGGSINNSGSHSINDLDGNVAATTHYGLTVNSHVSGGGNDANLNGVINTVVDSGGAASGASSGGATYAQIDYSFTLDALYDFDFSVTFSNFYSPSSVYFELVNTSNSTSVFYFSPWNTDPLFASGSLEAGSYHLQLVSGLRTSSGGGSYPEFATLNAAYDFNLTASAVPVPAAFWLFGSGLIGLVGVARRKAKALN